MNECPWRGKSHIYAGPLKNPGLNYSTRVRTYTSLIQQSHIFYGRHTDITQKRYTLLYIDA